MATENCGNCKYGFLDPHGRTTSSTTRTPVSLHEVERWEPGLVCRAHPPTPHISIPVEPDSWCGEYKEVNHAI